MYQSDIIKLDTLFDQATEKIGPFANALGFMRGVRGSKYYRKCNYPATPEEVKNKVRALELIIRVGKW